MGFGGWILYIFSTFGYLLSILAGATTFYEIYNGSLQSSTLLIVENIVAIIIILIICLHLFLEYPLEREDLPLDKNLGSYFSLGIWTEYHLGSHEMKVFDIFAVISVLLSGHLIFLGAFAYTVGIIGITFSYIVSPRLVASGITGLKWLLASILVIVFKVLLPIAILAGIVVFVIAKFFLK